MEIHPPLNVSYFYNGFRKYNIFIFIICFLCFLSEVAFGQKEKKDKQQFNKVTVCHNGETLEISESALQAHLNHGDTYGPCEDPIDYTGVITPYIPQVGRIEEKIGSDLTSLYKIYEQTGNAASNEIFTVSKGSLVLIDIYAVTPAARPNVVSFLSSEFGVSEYIDYSLNRSFGLNEVLTTVLLPIEKLPELISNDDIQRYRPVYTPINNGVVTSQGDIAQASDIARRIFNVSGQGINVGVLSDSYNALGLDAASDDVRNGDLPGDGNPVNNTQVEIVMENSSISRFSLFDEGRAMAQLIHDVAPGASLFFHTGVESAGLMARGILELHQVNGCQVVVDDITHYMEPFFTDGNIAKAVDIVAGNGVKYFTSAGNFGVNSYESVFDPANGNELNHDFHPNSGNIDIMQSVSFGVGFVRIVLQWDDNYQSVTPYTGAEVDLDMYIINDDGDTLVSNNDNNFGADPFTMMTFNVDGGFANSNIVISRPIGDNNVRFKYIVFESNSFKIEEYATGTSTIMGHANASGAITVGGVLYKNTPAFDTIPSISSFSSRGGLIMNEELTARIKPNVVAPHGGNTSVNFGDIYNPDGTIFNIDGDNFPNFFGTSASAAQAAGAAALLLNAFDKFGVNGDVKDLLQTTAIDMGSTGYDTASGYGFIQTDAAIMSFANPIPEITDLTVPEGVSPGLQVFEVTVEGKYLTEGSRVLFDGDTIENTVFVSSTQIKADIPIFDVEDDPPLYAITSAITPSGDDGGMSNPLYFYRAKNRVVTVQADYKTKKYGERLPEFTATVMIDSLPLAATGITLDSLGITNLTFTTPATRTSNVGHHLIHLVDITEELDPALLEFYDYVFKDTALLVEKMPITITPNDLSLSYGDKIEGITCRFDYDGNIHPDDTTAFLDALRQSYLSTFTGEDSIAIINRGRTLVNRGRTLVNGTGWMVSPNALTNRGRTLVNNGNVFLDIDSELLTNYAEDPTESIVNRGRTLVNGDLLATGTAYMVLENRGRTLVNDAALMNTDGTYDGFSDIVVVVDEQDSIVSSLFSIYLVSGLEVTWDPDSLHYIIPGGFIAPESENFEITYGVGNMNISPATLNATVDDIEIYLGDPLPIFTSEISGYKYNENDSIVFSSITYEPTEYSTVGVYEIIPTLEFRDLINYNFDPDPIIPGTLTVNSVTNGKIAMTRVHMGDDSEDLIIVNSDGSNPMTLVSEPEWIGGPAFSPDGMQIVFHAWDALGGNLWKINSDGTGLIQLTSDNNSQQADFSPDGTKIAFVNHGDIAIMDADGIAPPIILHVRGSWPIYSPDGQEIYFNTDGTLIKVNLITGDTTLISNDINNKPAFLRDGSKLIVTRESSGSGYDIISMNADGSGEVILHSGDVGGVTVSPDNTKITFIKDSVDDGYGYNYDLYEMNLDGSNVHKLFTQNDSGYNLRQPTWGMYPDDVYIPDPNFERALLDLGIDSDGEINQRILRSDAEAVTKLSVADPLNNTNLPYVSDSIRDLTGIEAFVNLRFLSCRINKLTNLDVSKNTKLTHLRCDNNKLSSLDVSHNVLLDTLWVGFNKLTSIDISNLSEMTVFYCNNNLLDSLDLSNNTKLTVLWCGINPYLGELDVSSNPDLSLLGAYGMALDSLDVSSNPALTNLRCYWNNLTFLDLSNNPNLEMVRCYHNQLTYLDLRNGNNAILDTLRADDNNLTCINVDNEGVVKPEWVVDDGVDFSNDCSIVYIPDANFEQALIDQGIDSDGVINQHILRSDAESNTSLNVRGEHPLAASNIEDLTGIEAFINLTYLDIATNELTDIDLSYNTALTYLDCNYNHLVSLDLSLNTALTYLNCSWNEGALTVLDVSQNTLLDTLICGYTDITSLDLSQNTALVYLKCDFSHLESLNISQNTALTYLYLESSPWLENLDVSQNSALIYLNCMLTNISILELSNNIALTRLICSRNNLTSLDVSQCGGLTLLMCNENNLTSLDVSQNVGLTGLYCDENLLTELDLRNGNNEFLINMNAQRNNLTCISVDDESGDHSDWRIDAGVTFSNDCNAGHSGPRTITGTVTSGDDGSPLIGVNIIIKGTTTGTITDTDGEYSIFVPGNDATLVVSSLGSPTVEEVVGDRIIVDINLNSNSGYSGARTITGTVTSGEDGLPLPGINILLQGTTTGAVTGIDGEYSIPIPGNDAVLLVSAVGDPPIEEIVGDRIIVDFVLSSASGARTSSMESSMIQGEITIYPNPVLDVITIVHADESVSLSDISIVIFDNYGVIYPISTSFIETLDGLELDLSELNAANYILHISDGKTLEAFRIQKE